MLFLCGFYELVCVRGAGAVGVARDELLPMLAFVVNRVAHCAGRRREEANERDAEDEDAAQVEAFAGRNFWEESIVLGTVVRFVVVERGGRARRVRSWTSSRSCYHQKKDEDEPHNHAGMRLKEDLASQGSAFLL